MHGQQPYQQQGTRLQVGRPQVGGPQLGRPQAAQPAAYSPVARPGVAAPQVGAASAPPPRPNGVPIQPPRPSFTTPDGSRVDGDDFVSRISERVGGRGVFKQLLVSALLFFALFFVIAAWKFVRPSD